MSKIIPVCVLVPKKSYTCKICKKVDKWGDTWRWRIDCKGTGYEGYKEIIITCSDKCRKKYENDLQGNNNQ